MQNGKQHWEKVKRFHVSIQQFDTPYKPATNWISVRRKTKQREKYGKQKKQKKCKKDVHSIQRNVNWLKSSIKRSSTWHSGYFHFLKMLPCLGPHTYPLLIFLPFPSNAFSGCFSPSSSQITVVLSWSILPSILSHVYSLQSPDLK